MILKYKFNDCTWKYKSIRDITVSKVSTMNIINKHTEGKIYDELVEIFEEVNIHANSHDAIKTATIDYHTGIFYPEKLLKYRDLLLVQFIDNDSSDTVILHNEAYLMTDDGDTIEKLM